MDLHGRIKRPHHVRIITVGNVEAGKTSIIKRFCDGRFSSKYQATVGVDFGATRCAANNTQLFLSFKSPCCTFSIFLFTITGFLLTVLKFWPTYLTFLDILYSKYNSSSSETLERWLNEMAQGMDNTSVVCVVCGNKSDKAHTPNKEVEKWVDLHKFSHFVVSAYTGAGIHEMFQSLLMQVLEVHDMGRDPVALWSSCNYSKEELQAVHQVRWSRSEYEKLGVDTRASRDDINRSYRRLAVLLHPDKSTAPGCEEAFKMLAAARTALLKRVLH
ncbi:dnaJ homolog subfamily C member 27-like isoform X1 [Amblyomma americanum]